MRLIDAKQLEKQIKENFKETPVVMGMLLRWIRKQPTAIEPVVRCKDCEHRVEPTKMCAHPKAIGWDAIEPDDDAFCSYGVRRNEDAAD